VVVRKVGTAVVTNTELVESINNYFTPRVDDKKS